MSEKEAMKAINSRVAWYHVEPSIRKKIFRHRKPWVFIVDREICENFIFALRRVEGRNSVGWPRYTIGLPVRFDSASNSVKNLRIKRRPKTFRELDMNGRPAADIGISKIGKLPALKGLIEFGWYGLRGATNQPGLIKFELNRSNLCEHIELSTW